MDRSTTHSEHQRSPLALAPRRASVSRPARLLLAPRSIRRGARRRRRSAMGPSQRAVQPLRGGERRALRAARPAPADGRGDKTPAQARAVRLVVAIDSLGCSPNGCERPSKKSPAQRTAGLRSGRALNRCCSASSMVSRHRWVARSDSSTWLRALACVAAGAGTHAEHLQARTAGLKTGAPNLEAMRDALNRRQHRDAKTQQYDAILFTAAPRRRRAVFRRPVLGGGLRATTHAVRRRIAARPPRRSGARPRRSRKYCACRRARRTAPSCSTRAAQWSSRRRRRPRSSSTPESTSRTLDETTSSTRSATRSSLAATARWRAETTARIRASSTWIGRGPLRGNQISGDDHWLISTQAGYLRLGLRRHAARGVFDCVPRNSRRIALAAAARAERVASLRPTCARSWPRPTQTLGGVVGEFRVTKLYPRRPGPGGAREPAAGDRVRRDLLASYGGGGGAVARPRARGGDRPRSTGRGGAAIGVGTLASRPARSSARRGPPKHVASRAAAATARHVAASPSAGRSRQCSGQRRASARRRPVPCDEPPAELTEATSFVQILRASPTRPFRFIWFFAQGGLEGASPPRRGSTSTGRCRTRPRRLF